MQDLIVCGRVQKSPHSLEDSLEGTIDRLADIASKCEAAIKDPTTLFFCYNQVIMEIDVIHFPKKGNVTFVWSSSKFLHLVCTM